MADIFLSYSKEDRQRASSLAGALEGLGWEVFWDRDIPSGKSWREVIEAELEKARAIVVVWTHESIKSAWVHEEADWARERGLLFPVLMDPVLPPIGFRSIQARDLCGWREDADDPRLIEFGEDLRAAVAAVAGPDRAVATRGMEQESAGRPRRARSFAPGVFWWLVRITAALVGVIIGFFAGGALGEVVIGGEARSFAYLIILGMIAFGVLGFLAPGFWRRRSD